MLNEEKNAYADGYRRVAGLDEAGRGCLAGPVTAGAVVLKQCPKFSIQIPKELLNVKDSKQLSPKKREEFYKIIINHPQIRWSVASVFPKTIDKINIKNAAELAMARAVCKMEHIPNFLIIDGKYLKNSRLKAMNHKLIIKADEKVFSCICASIIAKVTRDRKMLKYHKKYPQYAFNCHKGYSTEKHIRMLKKFGLCAIHRRTFKPVRQYQRDPVSLMAISETDAVI